MRHLLHERERVAAILTPVGEAVLAENPPQELPDFSVIDEATDEYENGDIDELLWEEELGLLDI